MSASEKNAQKNQPDINHSTIKAIRHLLNALDALQKTEYATDASCIIGRFLSDGIRVELDRLWGIGNE